VIGDHEVGLIVPKDDFFRGDLVIGEDSHMFNRCYSLG
jgi:hypothetical protein